MGGIRGNLLIVDVECQIRDGQERSKPSGAQFRNERKIKVCNASMFSLYDYGIHVMNEGAILIGGYNSYLLAFLL